MQIPLTPEYQLVSQHPHLGHHRLHAVVDQLVNRRGRTWQAQPFLQLKGLLPSLPGQPYRPVPTQQLHIRFLPLRLTDGLGVGTPALHQHRDPGTKHHLPGRD